MNAFLEEYIIRKRKRFREDWVNFKNLKRNELESICGNLTGHKFWDWILSPLYSVGGDILHTHHRVCRLCMRKEYKTEKIRD